MHLAVAASVLASLTTAGSNPCVPTPSPGSAEWVPTPAVVLLVAAPAKHLGQTMATIRQAMGAPSVTTSEFSDNRHERELCNTTFTLHYPGTVIQVPELPGGPREFLLKVQLSRALKQLELPVSFGDSQESVRCVLGQPLLMSHDAFTYYGPESEVGSDSVVLQFTEGRLTRIEWNYFID